MMKRIFIIGFITSILSFIACDEIDGPYIEYVGDCGDASLPVPIKRILVEDFTGHQCGNCPQGHKQVQQLKELYCDHIIPVSIHVGYFAETDESFPIDYTTDAGDEIDLFYGNSGLGLPNGLVNRMEYNNELVLSPSAWPSVVSSILSEDPKMDIEISASLTDNEREIAIEIEIGALETITGNLMLSVYFVEDSIISKQKDYESDPEDIENYIHRHVLRDVVNGTWGESVVNGQITNQEIINKKYTYLVNEDWVINNSTIVAFVYHANSESKEVIQASDLHLEFNSLK